MLYGNTDLSESYSISKNATERVFFNPLKYCGTYKYRIH